MVKKSIEIRHGLYLDPRPAAGHRTLFQTFDSVSVQLQAAIGQSSVMTKLRALLPHWMGPAAMPDHAVVQHIAVQVVQGKAALKQAPADPASDVPWDEFLRTLGGPDHEGTVKHMYLDTKGVVTVGVGTALFTSARAESLPFVVSATGKAATKAQIAGEYTALQKQQKGMDAEEYRWTLTLPQASIDAEAKRMAQGFEKDVAREYKGYDKYPVEVKEVLIDMRYQLGGNMHQFKNFKAAVELAQETGTGKYWETAARESNRPDAQASRNQWASDMILKGGGVKKGGGQQGSVTGGAKK